MLDPKATNLPRSIYDDDDDEDETSMDAASEFLEEAGHKTFIDEYKLRHDFVVKILLPADLTKEEASRLADHVRTMYFTQAA